MKDLAEFLRNYDEGVASITNRLRGIVLEIMPQANESLTGHKTINYHTDAGQMKGGMAYIAPLKDSVNLGFVDGIDLDDPEGLLKGTGKRLRHIKFKTSDEIDQQFEAIHALLRQAKDLKTPNN